MVYRLRNAKLGDAWARILHGPLGEDHFIGVETGISVEGVQSYDELTELTGVFLEEERDICIHYSLFIYLLY